MLVPEPVALIAEGEPVDIAAIREALLDMANTWRVCRQ